MENTSNIKPLNQLSDLNAFCFVQARRRIETRRHEGAKARSFFYKTKMLVIGKHFQPFEPIEPFEHIEHLSSLMFSENTNIGRRKFTTY